MFGFFTKESIVDSVESEIWKNGADAAAKHCERIGGTEADYDAANAQRLEKKVNCPATKLKRLPL